MIPFMVGDGHDELGGGRGNDIIYGGDGNDILYGSQGSDFLVGGMGADIFYGNSERDRFVLDVDSALNGSSVGEKNTDVVADFANSDRLYIDTMESGRSLDALGLSVRVALREVIDGAYTERNNSTLPDTVIYYTDAMNNDIILMVLEDYTGLPTLEFA